MKTLLQSRIQQHLRKQEPKPAHRSQPASSPSEIMLAPAFMHSDHALMIIDMHRHLFAINPSAVQLLGLAAEANRGQSVDTLADGALQALALRPTATLATTLFDLPDGRTILAKTRPLTGRNRRFLGWIVILQDVSRLMSETRLGCLDTPPAVTTLQSKIEALQELISMLPQFSQHQYWRHLLAEHMERITNEMATQLQQMMPISA